MKQLFPLPEYINSLMDKCNGLNDNESLMCYFGRNAYKIERSGASFIFYSKPSYSKTGFNEAFTFAGGSELKQRLTSDPYISFYARNEFTLTDSHLDNIGNFCRAFKKETKSKLV